MLRLSRLTFPLNEVESLAGKPSPAKLFMVTLNHLALSYSDIHSCTFARVGDFFTFVLNYSKQIYRECPIQHLANLVFVALLERTTVGYWPIRVCICRGLRSARSRDSPDREHVTHLYGNLGDPTLFLHQYQVFQGGVAESIEKHTPHLSSQMRCSTGMSLRNEIDTRLQTIIPT